MDRARAQATKSALSTRVYSVYIHGAVLYILLWHVWAVLSPVQRALIWVLGGVWGARPVIYLYITTRARVGSRVERFWPLPVRTQEA